MAGMGGEARHRGVPQGKHVSERREVASPDDSAQWFFNVSAP